MLKSSGPICRWLTLLAEWQGADGVTIAREQQRVLWIPVSACKRTQNYNDAYACVSRAGTPAQGRSAHIALKRAVIFDEILPDNMIDPLKLGLSALARHFGLTNHRKG
jgi:hypothetical protein